jgi:hypothetical protein
MKHHGRSTGERYAPRKLDSWNDLPDLDEFEYRLGRIKNDLDSEIAQHPGFGGKEALQEDRRRRREAKLVGSILATGTKNKKTYPHMSSENDWERDLVTDDDDKLPGTIKNDDVPDPEVKGSNIAPNLESNEDFADDYPVDDDRDQAEDAKLQREQQEAEKAVKNAKEAAHMAQQEVNVKKQDLHNAADKAKEAKKKSQSVQNLYSNATSVLNKAKQDVKEGKANETRIKSLQKEIRKKVKRAEKAVEDMDRKLYKKTLSCQKQAADLKSQNNSLSHKYEILHAQEFELQGLRKREEVANYAVSKSKKALHEAEALLEKLQAATKSAEEIEPTKSRAVGHFLSYFFWVMCVSLVAAVHQC